MSTIYAAGPIDLVDPNNVKVDWRAALSVKLAEQHQCTVIFDPSTAFKCANWGKPQTDRSAFIEAVNNAAIEEAEVFVAFLMKSSASVGVPIEIDMAHRLGKTIILMTDIEFGKSAYLDNRIPDCDRVYTKGGQEDIIEVLADKVSCALGCKDLGHMDYEADDVRV